MRLLSTILMVRRRRRPHLSGMGRDSRSSMLVADHHAADFMTRVQGVQPDLQMAAAMLSPTRLMHMLVNLLNTIPMEELLQRRALPQTTKTRNMGSTHVAAVVGTEMVATVAEVATTTTGVITNPIRILHSRRMTLLLLVKRRSARQTH